MKQEFKSLHWTDINDKPAGGTTQATGLLISWQNGPLGRGAERRAPNGAFVETVIAAAIDRINFYGDAGFDCTESYKALKHLHLVLDALNRRTTRRESAGTEGTHSGT